MHIKAKKAAKINSSIPVPTSTMKPQFCELTQVFVLEILE